MKTEDLKVGRWYWTRVGETAQHVFKEKLLAIGDDGILIFRLNFGLVSLNKAANVIAEVQRPWWVFW